MPFLYAALRFVLSLYQPYAAVAFAKLWLFDLACGIAGNISKYVFPGPLIAGQIQTEGFQFILGKSLPFLHLNDGCSYLSETFVWKSDDRNIVDLGVGRQEGFDLYGIEVFATGDDNVLLAVYQEIEAVSILLRHIAGAQEAILHQNLGSGLGITVVALHDAGTLYAEFAYFSLLYSIIVFVNYLAFPAKARHTDGAYLVYVLHAKMYAAWTSGF